MVLEASRELQVQAMPELYREAPVLAAAASTVVLGTDGTDATLQWTPTNAEARDVIEVFRAQFDERAARLAEYEALEAQAATPVLTPGPAVAPAP